MGNSKNDKYGSLHPILKYNDDLYDKDPIIEHKNKIENKGSVIWGIIKPNENSPGVSSKKIKKINKEIENNKLVYVFFSKSGKLKYYGKVIRIYDRDEIKNNENKFPEYYRNDLNRCVAGVEFNNFIEINEDISNNLRNYNDKNKELVFSNQTNPLYAQIIDDSFLKEVNFINEKINYSKFKEDLDSINLQYTSEIVLRFLASLIAKPFLLLTGLSGSGKTKIAQAFVNWITEDSSQYAIISVGANWTNRDPLLGYKNALDDESYIYPDNDCLDLLIAASKPENNAKPYFLILDEMNLSHVERYFADFLSAMESDEPIRLHTHGGLIKNVPEYINVSSNVFIIGTVNIDETTYMFSPKVLDRAHVIEFRVTRHMMESFLMNPNKINMNNLENSGLIYSNHFMELYRKSYNSINLEDVIKQELLMFFSELSSIGAEYAFRTASDIFRYIEILKNVSDEVSEQQCLDYAIVQKLLPKLHGSRKKLQPVIKTLGDLCLEKDFTFLEYISGKSNLTENEIKYPITLKKLERMYNRLISNGFTSFAEA